MSLPSKQELQNVIDKHLREATLILTKEEAQNENNVPDQWLEFLQQQSEGNSPDLLAIWEPMRKNMPVAVDFVANKVQGVSILKQIDKAPALIYWYKDDGDWIYYRGGGTERLEMSADLEKRWDELPESLRAFYAIHDGWVEYPDKVAGPLPVESLSFLSEPEWDYNGETEKGLPFSLKDILAVLSNGGNDYLCLNLSLAPDQIVQKALIWRTDEPNNPKLDVHFWEYMDKLMIKNFMSAEPHNT